MRIQVRMKHEHGNYRKGERLNLPGELANDLIKKGVAEKMAEISYQKKVVFAQENKRGRRSGGSGSEPPGGDSGGHDKDPGSGDTQ